MSSVVLRPGIALGCYPERASGRERWLERASLALEGALRARPRSLPRRVRRFIEDVASAGSELRDASRAEIAAAARNLRCELAREGLREPLLVRSFALVREVARGNLGMEPYDVQLAAGWAMARGMLAEMETGEGKTLSATLTAASAALAGIPVHVISANDYLVQRDADAMRPVYEALGLRVGAVTDRVRGWAARRAAYACDVTYGTSSQIAFDYLRDRLSGRGRTGELAMRAESLHRGVPLGERLLLRGLCFAVVDEADSCLIDEARTPLVLAGEADAAERSRVHRRAVRVARSLVVGDDFTLRESEREQRVGLTEGGRRRLAELAAPLGAAWAGPRRREEWVVQALSALHLFERDRHYLVREGRVEIIDGPTGRPSKDRSWQRGLHQLIEVKEGCQPTPERVTLARISYQQFFRRYLHLAGMTGTAREVSGELWSAYRLRTLVVPPRLTSRRRFLGTKVHAEAERKWAAVVERIGAVSGAGRPVLVGTSSVATSEDLGRRLSALGLQHRVLNARQDAEEAAIVAEAGEPGRITVATNMAGRGTDIRLAPRSAEAGGLHVIATELGSAARVDRQLFGRAGRQGDAGSCEVLLSLEDERVQLFCPESLLRLARGLSRESGVVPGPIGKILTWMPQRAEEHRDARMRRSLVALEEYLEDLLAFSGATE